MKFNCRDIGDFIIVRSNGIPAYNFAVVIDDHLMKVSHVVRGEDHLSNTALQILLYNALGFEKPEFAHHSLILGKDRSKLSKRHGSVAVKEFREKGILPEALLNYLSLLGSSQADGKEVLSSSEIIAGFSLERAGKSGAIFDEDKLKWLNGIYIRNLEPDRLTEALVPFIQRCGYDYEKMDKTRLLAIIKVIKDNLVLLTDIGRELAPFYDETFKISEEAAQVIKEDSALRVLKAFYETLTNMDMDDDSDAYSATMDKVRQETMLKGKALFLPIRAAISGVLKGPELDKIYGILGRNTVLARLRHVLDQFSI
jgi:nondiscriminating glutamyl-tRNA synthetase